MKYDRIRIELAAAVMMAALAWWVPAHGAESRLQVDLTQFKGWNHAVSELDTLPVTRHSRAGVGGAEVARVFRAWKKVAYQEWDDAYWSTPAEFRANGGQCRDYAVAEYVNLYGLGVADADMEFLAVRIKKSGVDHAVLRVRLNGRVYVLDNLAPRVEGERWLMQRYRLIYGINRTGWRDYRE